MRWIAFVRGALCQLPVETVLVTAAAAGAIGLNHDLPERWCERMVLAALVATPLAFATHRLSGFGRRLPLLVGGLAAAGVFAVITATVCRERDIERAAFGWPYALSLVVALMVPFIVPGPGFARFVRRFFEQTTIWTVVCGAAIGALRVVAVALEQLFDLRVDRLFFDAAIVVGAGLILVYLHRLRSDDAGGRIPEVWRRLATMVGAPFVSAMLAILVAYEITARARGELPRNMLSPLIMAAGLAGFVSTLILSAVLDERPTGPGILAPADPHRWARTWSVRLTRAFPAVLLALLPMAGWALAIRIGEHGLTPFRAARETGLVCLAVLSLLGTLRWWRGRPALTWQVPAAIAGFALVAAFGPFSVIQRSIDSQARRAGRVLDAAGIGRTVPAIDPSRLTDAPVADRWLDADEVAAATPAQRVELSPPAFDALVDAIHELAMLGGEPAVRRVLSGETERCARPSSTYACLAQLGAGRENLTQVSKPAWQ